MIEFSSSLKLNKIHGPGVRTRLVTHFENLDSVSNVLFPLLKNSKSDEERGHRLRILHTLRRHVFMTVLSSCLKSLANKLKRDHPTAVFLIWPVTRNVLAGFRI